MKKILLSLILLASTAFAGSLAGRRVSSFTLPDSTGRYYDILDYRGKVLVIELMKTDCPHCAATAKTLENVRAKYGDRVSILAIVNSRADNPQKVADYVARHRISYPLLWDFGQASAALLQLTPRTPTVSFPTIFVVDANGIIVEDISFTDANQSFFDGPGLMKAIDKALAAGKAPAAKK